MGKSKLSLSDAIKHYEEVAERLEGKDGYAYTDSTCDECAKEHRQLAEWLRKLEKYEEGIEKIKEQINDYKGRNNMWDTANGLQFALECLEVNADDSN